MNLSTIFHPHTDGLVRRTIQNSEYMLRACVIDFKGNWDDHLPLIEFTNNNNYHYSILMAPYEAIYGKRCWSPIGWFEVGEAGLIGLDIVHQFMEKVKVIQERLKMTQSLQKSYFDIIESHRSLKQIIGYILRFDPWKVLWGFVRMVNLVFGILSL